VCCFKLCVPQISVGSSSVCLSCDSRRSAAKQKSHQKRLPCVRLISFAEQDRHQESSSKPLSAAHPHSAPFLFSNTILIFLLTCVQKGHKASIIDCICAEYLACWRNPPSEFLRPGSRNVIRHTARLGRLQHPTPTYVHRISSEWFYTSRSLLKAESFIK
jgi:hypothetical protein